MNNMITIIALLACITIPKGFSFGSKNPFVWIVNGYNITAS